MMKRTYLLVTSILLTLCLISGCDFGFESGKEDPVFNQTDILRVKVTPNPVAVGDTATFTCIIEDSTDERFRFSWYLDAPTRITEDNHIQWIADVEPGDHSFSVRADNGSEDSLSVAKSFTVEVVE